MNYALAKPMPYMPPNNFRNAQVLSVHDGDTCRVAVDAGFEGCPLVWGANNIGDNRVRLAGINAPELSTDKGPPAKAHLQMLCATYGCDAHCVVEALGRDNYGRIVVTLYGLDPHGAAINLNQKMLDDGFAEVYQG